MLLTLFKKETQKTMNKFILLSIFSIAGCASVPPAPLQPVIEKIQIQKVTVPESLLLIPPKVAPIDLTTATQKTVAKWIIDNDTRQELLEANIKSIQKINN